MKRKTNTAKNMATATARTVRLPLAEGEPKVGSNDMLMALSAMTSSAARRLFQPTAEAAATPPLLQSLYWTVLRTPCILFCLQCARSTGLQA